MDSPSCSCAISPSCDEADPESRTVLNRRDSLIVLACDTKYNHVDALRKLMRRDSRFAWVDLSSCNDVRHAQIFVRQRGATAAGWTEDDAQLRALLESDSIPQYVWPAAGYLQQWIRAHRSTFASKTILELGCGTGIIGLTVAQYAKLVVLTDCSAVSLAMTLESLARNNVCNCSVAALSWGREDQMAHVKKVCHVDGFDVVIGSDVFYFSSAMKSGLATVRSAFAPTNNRAAIFLCGSVARSERMEAELDEVPIQEGFELTDFVAQDSFRLYCWKLAAR
ncbi:hypothetical protein ABB37_02228 [Leptomonas pyrrhocoris]|uniref:Methyltransferase n=1 Tax=Leptomonas pyrrhocoris TaxID=157538 RepID=A0A0N0DYI3_LEPPY|nr:hypothetical protein ABB37_02228 [Leptomonas pyrrhocoris]KPA84152.1 hypothetical protein ABB37_02228 [Leptomonas pyrrhocoris]|eukprot:XP_015662591.1 hypothetical protein ABB37_02228 [Leptomonas pyrrhocoris]